MSVQVQIIEKESEYSPKYLVVIVNTDGPSMTVESFYIQARALFYKDKLNWVINGGVEPNPDDYDLDPIQVCELCGHTYTTHSSNKTCQCIPF